MLVEKSKAEKPMIGKLNFALNVIQTYYRQWQ